MAEKIKTLIVDDEPLARRNLRVLLEKDPQIEIVDECRNGREAVKAINTLSPDLIFLDIQMPEMDGFDVLARTGAEHIQAIIFVTAFDQYALKAGSDRPAGVGLGLVDTSTRAWNADVYTSWEFLHSFSLYGRLGYAQNDSRPLFSGASLVPGDPRRFRDGVNYGVGLRYILSQALGLRVEYSRFGRFAGESSSVSVLPESDQVTIGVQYRF